MVRLYFHVQVTQMLRTSTPILYNMVCVVCSVCVCERERRVSVCEREI